MGQSISRIERDERKEMETCLEIQKRVCIGRGSVYGYPTIYENHRHSIN